MRFTGIGTGFALLRGDCSLKTESSKSVDSSPSLFYNRVMRWILTSIMPVLITASAYGQYSTPDDSLYANVIVPKPELRWVIDVPTAGILPRGTFDMDMRTFPIGGVQTTLNIGLGHRFMVGVGYGSRHLTGHAVDLGALVAGKLRWDWPLYEQLAGAMKESAKQVGVPVEWGGDWRTFKDGPHFQLPWREYP